MEKHKRPATFLEGIDRIIFDMDGVITSEQNYWNAAALTVHEMQNGKEYFGNQDIETSLSSQQIKDIRTTVFVNDQLISLLKDRGVNTNWDLAYVVLCISGIVLMDNGQWTMDNKGPVEKQDSSCEIYADHFNNVYQYLIDNPITGYEIYDFIEHKLCELTGKEKRYFRRQGELWNICQQVFQEWYLGDEVFNETYGQAPKASGKPGLVFSEQPILPLDELKDIIETLYSAGIILGVGTGRPFVEIDHPLISWDIKKYFDEQSYVTYREVMDAEQKLEGIYAGTSLAKPHPYVFLKAIYGRNYSDMALVQGDYDKRMIKSTLIIGDAGSDIMAAKAMNCKFAAVLTGVSGEKARNYFKEMGADYILNNIRELIVNS
ncbi:HAD hydrolase-like protein [Petroclostridium sp. X23]|uniref:HAD family hydrolase n=1 Tax=Petroclostridium sp. X23 TaxID=3045146 RepID=UPI0024AC9082|nr:HAD hydrolase-like protein [Petroclostridium sp. X23]WHH61407.1 HAD hydrolase-like protein [Petroclostridium sp. X23]